MPALADAPLRAAPPEAPSVPRAAAVTGPAEPAPPPGTALGRAARRHPMLRPAGYYLASRLLIVATTWVLAVVDPGLRVMRTLGSAWDGRWYLLIAAHGYPPQLFNEGDGSRWAFFPAFPGAVRATSAVTHLSLPDAATLAAFVFGLTSALAVWLAIREVCGRRLADRAVLLYVFCPTAYVLSLGYTEGLFFTAAALCLFALSRRWWFTAALCACVAGLTRNGGAFVVLAVVVTALVAAWRGRTLRPAAAAVVAPLGLASFMAYGWATVGTPVPFVAAEHFWRGQHFVWFTTPPKALVAALEHGPNSLTFVPDIMAAAALVLGILGIWLLDHLREQPCLLPSGTSGTICVPTSWWIYTVGSLLLAYSAYSQYSIPRYTMAAFPLFVAFAAKIPARLTIPLVAGMAALQCGLLAAVLTPTVHHIVAPLLP